jgi:EpsI family protein
MADQQQPPETPVAVPAAQPGPAPARARGPSLTQLAVVVAILGVGVVVTALTSNVTKVSEPGLRLVDGKPFLPENAGAWHGGAQEGLTDMERALLPADTEGARRVYRDAASNDVYCSVILAGREVTSIHRPELCLPGQGWTIESEHVESIPVAQAPGGTLNVMRMNVARSVPTANGGLVRRQYVFLYWFVGKDRLTPHHWQRILWTTQDRVWHDRNHRWAYFLINALVPATPGDPALPKLADDTMRLLGRFVQEIYPALMPDQP